MFNKILTIASILVVIAIAFVANTAKAQIVPDGLIHGWNFENIQGDTVPDVVGNNDVMIIRGASPEVLKGGESDPQIIDGKVGKALNFDGDGDYAESKEDIPISGTAPRTLAAWAKWNTKSNFFHIPVSWGWSGETPTVSGGLFCIATWENNQITMWGYANDHRSPFSAEPGTWYYVTVTYDNETELKIYVGDEVVYDKSDIKPLDTGGPDNELKLTLAKRGGDVWDRAWGNCAVDEIAIYDRALSKDEVMKNVDAGGVVASVDPADKLSVTWGDIKVSR